MGRVFFMRNVRDHEVASYEALGWVESHRKFYALDEVSVCMSWEHDRDPVEPEPPCYHVALPKPSTRDVVRWNFAPWDLICVIGLALAGLAWGAIDWIRGNK